MGAAMIEAIHFKNYKALRDTTLPLGRLTLLVGPNGSGKSTALEALTASPNTFHRTVGVTESKISVEFVWEDTPEGTPHSLKARDRGTSAWNHTVGDYSRKGLPRELEAARVYSFDAGALARPVTLLPKMVLAGDGTAFAGVVDRLRDDHPERFEALSAEFARWLPEFDRVLFDTPAEGKRAIKLRTRVGGHAIPAGDVSQGTLLALAILTLAYLPDPPPIVGLEEPGRGIHPRLLRDVRDAMYRLAYPESVGEDRPPVQVIATTHSPYLLDLFREHPQEIVIADKVESNVTFTRLTDLPNYKEILADAALGEVWYSGVLGGVPGDR